MSSINEMIEMFETLSFSDKISANERIASIIRKEGGGKTSKTSKTSKARASKGESLTEKPKEKRKCAAGTLAWQAYVKHVKTSQPDAFEGIKKESEKLTVIKGIRAADEGYDAWVAAWIAEYKTAEASASSASSASASSASEAEEEEEAEPVASPMPAPAPVSSEKKKTVQEKLAELKAKKAVSSPAPAAEAKETKEAKVEKKEKKAIKKTKKTEEPQMAQREIDGVMYWHEPETNALWEVTGENFADGAVWIGYFQPGNDKEPIRITDGVGQ